MNQYFFLLIALFGVSGCQNKETAPTTTTLDFSCIQRFDVQGQSEGTHGSCATFDDWRNIKLSPEESAYLSFTDTINTSGTNATDIKGIAFFPNPVMMDGVFSLILLNDGKQERVKLRLAIVDESRNTIQQLSLSTSTDKTLAIQIPKEKYKTGSYYRLYYRASTAANPLLFEGYGNFLVCKSVIVLGKQTIEKDCL
jgi:hypothetical protein